MRCFIAFPISEEIKKELITLQHEINEQNPNLPIKWVEPENMHVTVEFLGDLELDQVEKVKTILTQAIPEHHAFEYNLEKLTAFPDLNNPRVIVIKVKSSKQQGHLLHQAVWQQLNIQHLIKNKQPWKAHLTIGRLKGEGQLDLENIKLSNITWLVNQVNFYSSELTPQGPVYSIIEKYYLN
ncbi:MAG: RNA 2',3'-cyclic phosphodiesterase [bacterium]